MNKIIFDINFIAVNFLAMLLMLLGAREVFLFFNSKVIEGFYLYGETAKAAEYVYQGETVPKAQFIFNYLYGLLLSGLAGVAVSLFMSYWIGKERKAHWLNIVALGVAGVFCSFLVSRIRFNFNQLVNFFFDFYGLIGVKPVLLINGVILLSGAFYLLLKLYSPYGQNGGCK